LVSCTNFGLITVKTRKNCVFAFTRERRVRKVFNNLTDQQLADKRVEAIISEEKQFGIKYSYEKEIIAIDFYYGFWNEHGWPQYQ